VIFRYGVDPQNVSDTPGELWGEKSKSGEDTVRERDAACDLATYVVGIKICGEDFGAKMRRREQKCGEGNKNAAKEQNAARFKGEFCCFIRLYPLPIREAAKRRIACTSHPPITINPHQRRLIM
jgi:hypothetical protein